jgi:ribosomal protein S18 acetylase RimI-like enzyme
MSDPIVRGFAAGDAAAVEALWGAAFPDPRPWATPPCYLERKRARGDDLLLVATHGGTVAGVVAAGYDGVRGWIYHLAVAPAQRRRGVGRALMAAAEGRLAALGCPKVNLQVMPANGGAVAFYERLGYRVEPRVSLGKALA